MGRRCERGDRAELEDLRMAFQVCGRSEDEKRPRARLRLVGLEVGRKTWPAVLRGCERTKLVVTDTEAAVEGHVRNAYPNARHQFCEWHVGYSLDWSLIQDKVPSKERKTLRGVLERILWRRTGAKRRRRLYERFIEQLSSARRASGSFGERPRTSSSRSPPRSGRPA
jgi:hypothetical protein